MDDEGVKDKIVSNIAVGCAIPDDSSEEPDVSELCNGDLIEHMKEEFSGHNIETNCREWKTVVYSGDSAMINCEDDSEFFYDKFEQKSGGRIEVVNDDDREISIYGHGVYGVEGNDGAYIWGASGTCNVTK